jgi:hypothetical protein
MAQPSKTTILWDNLTDNATMTCSGSLEANYPAANLNDDTVSITTRTTNDTGKKTWSIDFGSSVELDTFAIAGHNLSPSGIFSINRGNASPPDPVTFEYSTLYDSSYNIYGASRGVGQTFKVGTVGDNADHYLKTINVRLYKTGSPGNTVMNLHPATATTMTTGTVLATSTVAQTALSTSPGGNVAFSFTGNIKLEKDTYYGFTLQAVSGGPSDYVTVPHYTTFAYVGGSRFYLFVGNWQIQAATDLVFSVQGVYVGSMTLDSYIHYWSSPETVRYLQFTASEDTTENYHEVGLMWAGKRYELPFNPQIPISLLDNEEIGQLLTSGGQKWSYVEKRTRGYRMSFIEDVTPAMYASLEEIYLDRSSKPFFIHLKPTDCGSSYTYDPVMLVHTTEFSFSIDGKDKRPGTWTIEEEL